MRTEISILHKTLFVGAHLCSPSLEMPCQVASKEYLQFIFYGEIRKIAKHPSE